MHNQGKVSIREFLQNNVLIFDGAMGTYYSSIVNEPAINCEMANIQHPEVIESIHKEYIAAGAHAIKTNTFGVNRKNFGENSKLLEQLVDAAVEIARRSANDTTYIFADIGPIDGEEEEKVVEQYKEVVDLFLKQGINYFLFETNSSTTGLFETARYIKEKSPEAFIINSFAVLPDGYSSEGRYYRKLLSRNEENASVDILGLNCVCGPAHMLTLLENVHTTDISIMPNAGYPVVRGRRTFYSNGPTYYAEQLENIVKKGVQIVGGCCGTTPAHIKAFVERLGSTSFVRQKIQPKSVVVTEEKDESKNYLWRKLEEGKKVIAVELDSPKNADLSGFMESARRLQTAGVDTLTIADCPIAVARMDSALLACKVKRELGLDVIPHMTCRDRNINAIKALLLGMHAEEIYNILAITGDPIPNAQRNEVSSVYQFNSRKLAAYIDSLNAEVFDEGYKIYGALNVNARNFEVELRRAEQKIEHGMVGFLTQPVLTQEAVENLAKARERLSAKILGGIIPVVSEKNARFMDSEVNGIRVSEEIISQYVGKNREEGEQLAVEISLDMAKKIKPYIDGYYLITPFNRVALMEKIIEGLRE